MINDDATELPDAVRDIVRLYLDRIAVLTQKIDDLHFKLRAATKVADAMRRPCTVPGVGLVTAGAIMAFAPDLRTFASGRNFATSLGRVPGRKPRMVAAVALANKMARMIWAMMTRQQNHRTA